MRERVAADLVTLSSKLTDLLPAHQPGPIRYLIATEHALERLDGALATDNAELFRGADALRRQTHGVDGQQRLERGRAQTKGSEQGHKIHVATLADGRHAA